MLIYISLSSWLMSMSFTLLKHPLSLGFILLLQTITASMILGNLNLNYWFSYILFLVMIGGLLVLFIYMTSIASNEKFKFSKILNTLFTLFITFYLFSMFKDNFFSFTDSLMMDYMKFNFMEINFSMNKLTSAPNWIIFLILILYLLISLIVVVKIAYTKMGTLRPWS